MGLITINVCKNLLIKKSEGKVTLSILLAAFGIVFMLLQEYLALKIIFIPIFIVLAIFLPIYQGKKDKKLKENKFYLVEDVFINVEKAKRVMPKTMTTYEECTIKFSKNGTYFVVIKERKEPDNPSCDYSAVNFSKPGDKFYLLVLDGERPEILKCFNARYYELLEDDFDLIDGKYHPKKV